ncbi:hypothetical protein BRC89_12920 [Halobacteriales archaeon QS_4_70_19]|nr:MAG: hypothetical protein BRC89_12920 [Halobacteriales archaeon QS_4_70_19]
MRAPGHLAMRQGLVVALVVALVLPSFAGVAAAQSQQHVGGTVVVEAGDTVGGFTAYASRVVVRGTVDGDLTAFAGRVVVEDGGEVTGRVRAFAGSVVVAGSTGGNAVAYAGHVEVAEPGRVGGSFGAVAGSVTLAGTVDEDATTVAGDVTLAPSGEVDGFLTYVGTLDDQGGSVTLGARHVSELSLLPPLSGPGGIIFALYLLAADLVAGSLFLTAFPGFADDAAETVLDHTVVGLPLALAGLVVYLVLLWVGSIYGRYLLGAGLLSFTERDGRYLALFVGVPVTAVLSLFPIVGDLVRLLLVLAGVGVVALGFRAAYESVGERRSPRPTDNA